MPWWKQQDADGGELLLVTASIGCYLPAPRAADLDLLEVLRSE